MGQVVTIGLDIAKSVFEVHGVDSAGVTVLRRRPEPGKYDWLAGWPPAAEDARAA